MSGFAGLAEAGGKGVSYLPGFESAGKSIQETGKESSDYWRESMTPAGKEAEAGGGFKFERITYHPTPAGK